MPTRRPSITISASGGAVSSRSLPVGGGGAGRRDARRLLLDGPTLTQVLEGPLALLAVPPAERGRLNRRQRLARGLEPSVGFFVRGPPHHVQQVCWHVVAGQRQVGYRSEEMMVHHAGERVRVERHGTGEHLEGDDAEGVLVALR